MDVTFVPIPLAQRTYLLLAPDGRLEQDARSRGISPWTALLRYPQAAVGSKYENMTSYTHDTGSTPPEEFRKYACGQTDRQTLITTLRASTGRKQSIVMSMSGCLSVCLSARIIRKPDGRTSPNFVHVAYGRGSVFL